MDISIHHVKSITFSSRFQSNGNSRTIRIVTENFEGHESSHKITVYGETDALESLPKAHDFRNIDQAGFIDD